MIHYFNMEHYSNFSFIGQQEGENIISVITPHKMALIVEYIKLFFISALLLVGFISFNGISRVFVVIGVVSSLVVLVVGFLVCRLLQLKRVVYITDRRIIRFEPSNIFVINNRSLTWENILKVKTFSPNVVWRMLNLGNIIVHSKTTSTGDNNPNQILIGNDDIVLKNIYFYRDLGNYIDKILYTYNNNRDELKNIRSFVTKVKGERY